MRNSVVVIAEAGVNYNGDIGLAKEMVKAASNAGADIVKFQTGIPKNVISVFAEKAKYQKTNTGDEEGNESQLEMCSKLMLPWEVYPELIDCCREYNIEFLSTPFDIPSAEFLHSLGMKLWKIPSGEITNLPLLRYIASFGEPIIMSTGMSYVHEIREAITALNDNGAGEITLLHCNTEYPTPFCDANLLAIRSLKQEFSLPTGYSDHTLGIEAAVAATALGATVIEKHFTLDRNLPGPDQICSAEPDELEKMITSIRNIEAGLGTGIKIPTESEKNNINIARKSIVAAQFIKKGERFTDINITCKRPGGGISPMKWDEVIGMESPRDFSPDEMIEV